ncbi:MAG TPA: response regulator [bacterium]|nr:response regulator [bacterium]HQL62934.1 response regulator [bacterium]
MYKSDRTQSELLAEIRKLQARVADIERAEAEKTQTFNSLQRREAYLRNAIEAADAVAYFLDYRTGTYIFLSSGIEDLTGYAEGELTHSRFLDLVQEEILLSGLRGLSHEEAVRKLVSGEENVWRAEYRIRTRTGEEKWLDNGAVQILDEQGTVVASIGLLWNITPRKRAEQKLLESERKYRSLFNSMISGFALHKMVCDETGRISDCRFLEVNPAFESIMELKASEVVGKTMKEVFPDLEDTWIEHYNQAACSETPTRFEVYCKDLNKYFEAIAYSPESGRFATIITDITDRRNLEEQLRQAHKMEAVGQLAGGIAHDFNNLLTGILGNLSLAQTRASSDIMDYLTNAEEAADRAASLVQQLLAFSRKSQVQFKRVNLNALVEETYRLVRETIDRRIEIGLLTEPDLPDTLADASQINSVLMNLCLNARDAIEEIMHGRKWPERRNDRFQITIETSTARIDQRYCNGHSEGRPGLFVMLSVTDNGSGMDLETRRRVFEPFFTTKDIGKGTGLGLATSYGIIRQHNGWINVYSEPGLGTTFRIYFSAAPGMVEEVEMETIRDIRGGNETILLVDDEELIRDLGQSILERMGYTVLLASDGNEGLRVYHRERKRIDLTILDLSMPYLSGQEVLEQILAVDPNARIIISSGYSENGYVHPPSKSGMVEYIAKPYRPDELAKVVRDILDR